MIRNTFMYISHHEFMLKLSKAYDNDFPLTASPCGKKTKKTLLPGENDFSIYDIRLGGTTSRPTLVDETADIGALAMSKC